MKAAASSLQLSRDDARKLGKDMLRVSALILMFGGVLAAAAYRLSLLGLPTGWAVLLAAGIAVIFFSVFSRSPLLPTVLVVAFSFGPAVVAALSKWRLAPALLSILFGAALIALLIYVAIAKADYFKGKKWWWAAPGVFGLMFLLLGIFGLTRLPARVGGLVDLICFGSMALLCVVIGLIHIGEARKGTEWADAASGVLLILLGVGLAVLSVVLLIVDS